MAPNNTPFPPPPNSHQVYLRYDDAGNPFCQNDQGQWVPYTGPFTQVSPLAEPYLFEILI